MNKYKNKLDLMYHPVRIRIIRLLTLKTLNTKEIGEELADVPTGSLYRQIKLLYDGGFLEVVKTIPKRGTVEKYYRVKKGSTDVRASENDSLDTKDLISQFRFFTDSVNNDYVRYLETLKHHEKGDTRDRITYHQYILYLTVEERNELYKKVLALLDKFDRREKAENDYKAWLVSTIMMPTLEHLK